MKDFYDLDVWKECRKYRILISKTVMRFPVEEKYRLTDQLVRAARSITTNIAEGHGRYHYQENIQFCRTSRGSLTETLDHLICAYDEKYISKTELTEFKKMYSLCLKLINGYVAYLKKRKDGEST